MNQSIGYRRGLRQLVVEGAIVTRKFCYKVVESLDRSFPVVFTRFQAQLAISTQLVNAEEYIVLTPGKVALLHQVLDVDAFAQFQIPEFKYYAVMDVIILFARDDSSDDCFKRFGVLFINILTEFTFIFFAVYIVNLVDFIFLLFPTIFILFPLLIISVEEIIEFLRLATTCGELSYLLFCFTDG
jgi:hypothetical protein